MSSAALLPLPRAVLFDLDGTLIDSAPDLAGAANDMLMARGLPALPYGELRSLVGSGARGMVGRAFGLTPEDPGYEALRADFLDRYQARMTRETHMFEGIWPMLVRLQDRGVPWGIVTNKARRFSEPLAAALGLARGAAALVSGDSTACSKPHPEPLLEAARRMAVAPEGCWYVGDDLRDAQAGRAAGMRCIVAAWGYLGVGEPVERWGADAVIDTPDMLLKLLGMA